VGEHCESYAKALETAHQSDLDVIAVDDIPTAEALRQLMILAETGHLVIANLHAESTVDAFQRLFDAAGTEVAAFRRALAANLFVITSQILVPKADSTGRAAVYEWLRNSKEVAAAILDGNLSELKRLQSISADSMSFENALSNLVSSGTVSAETANLRKRPA
jgi:twitching motility protein PilT